ncbi:response regulator (plasmid) [Paraburkholderia sp. DD10]|uniref:response regulator n=1 Tax=Paraburkholderia sp. DD10 TaxID=3409691 RepID=UPI003BA33DCE
MAHILIAEDDVLVRLALVEVLRAAGFAVIEAGSADDALAYIRAGGKVDLLFSDIQMSGVLDGQQLAGLIASDHPGIPVILTSGDTQPGASVPMALFVRKPYDIAHMMTLFFSVLGLRPPEGDS